MRADQHQLRPQITLQTSLARRQKVSWRRASAGDNIDNDSDAGFGGPIPCACQRSGDGRPASSRPLHAAATHHKPEAAAATTTTFRATERPTERDSIILKAFPADELTHICVDLSSRRGLWRKHYSTRVDGASRRDNLRVDTTRTCSTRR